MEGPLSVEQRVPRDQWPWWVRLASTGAPSRGALLFWAGLYFVSAVVSVLVGIFLEDDLVYALAFAGLFLVLGGGHWLAARWLERHGAWEDPKRPGRT